MAVYLIDYENVGTNGLVGIRKLTEADTVIIFIGNKLNALPVEAVQAMLNCAALIKMKKVRKTAKNYLDFQLATCLGGMVERGDDKEFYIISRDNGFGAIIDYWKTDKASAYIELRTSISPTLIPTTSAPKPVPTLPPAPEKAKPAEAGTPLVSASKIDEETKKSIRNLVKDEKLNPHEYTGIYNLFMEAKDRDVFKAGVVNLFEAKRGVRLYNILADPFEKYLAKV